MYYPIPWTNGFINTNYGGYLGYNNYQLMQNLIMCVFMLQICNEMFNQIGKNQYEKFYPIEIRNEDFFDAPSFKTLDKNCNKNIEQSEFTKEYIKQFMENSLINENSTSKSLSKIKKEAENIYKAIKGDESGINKTRYGAFLDFIDGTDEIIDGKYYNDDFQRIINKIKKNPNAKLQGNKSLSEILDEKINFVKKKPVEENPKTENKKFNPAKERDYDISCVYQGDMGDCYFLTALAKHPEFIKKSGCLKWNDDGSADVFLYNVDKNKQTKKWEANGSKVKYHITNEELEQNTFDLKKTNGEKVKIKINPKQDLTLKALEIGYIKSCGYNFEKTYGGNLGRAVRMLFGNNGISKNIYWVKPENYTIEDLANADYCAVDKAVSNSKSIVLKNGVKIIVNHAYIFNYYDKNTNTVSISNPWHKEINNKNDDIIIPYDEFKKIFNIQLIKSEGCQNPQFMPLNNIIK